MGSKTGCDICGGGVVGIFSDLSNVNGMSLCPKCLLNPPGSTPKYYCNVCKNHSSTALRKGNGWIEFILYLFYIIPGIIYSVWRRSGQPNVCPVCKVTALIPAASKPRPAESAPETREEKECPHCAEKILVKAKLCKHCGQAV